MSSWVLPLEVSGVDLTFPVSSRFIRMPKWRTWSRKNRTCNAGQNKTAAETIISMLFRKASQIILSLLTPIQGRKTVRSLDILHPVPVHYPLGSYCMRGVCTVTTFFIAVTTLSNLHFVNRLFEPPMLPIQCAERILLYDSGTITSWFQATLLSDNYDFSELSLPSWHCFTWAIG